MKVKMKLNPDTDINFLSLCADLLFWQLAEGTTLSLYVRMFVLYMRMLSLNGLLETQQFA